MNHPFRILNSHQSDPDLARTCALAVMAKAPLPGRVKTRLQPPLTAEQAAALNSHFLRDTVANLEAAARQSGAARWVISYTPQGAEAAFLDILPAGALLLPQREGDFGERLLGTATDLLACGFGAVCLIDSDSPTVPTGEFARAADLLLAPGSRSVLGPSTDGGYYLIGLQRPEPNLFARIRWSTEHVAAETQERAREIELPMELLRTWYDVDDAASLARLREELSGSGAQTGYPAPHTRAWLEAAGFVARKNASHSEEDEAFSSGPRA